MKKDRKLNRLQGYDYSRDALYFITSFVHDRICSFGKISEGKMQLNEYGEIAERQLSWMEQQYTYVVLHNFIVMPNHIHAIVEINHEWLSKEMSINTHAVKQPKVKSLSELIGSYKTTSSKKIHLAGLPEFKWQRSFHDHIIKNEQSYYRISNYISNNPSNWRDNKFYC
jgi:REP element-mobilizing transposase RayT